MKILLGQASTSLVLASAAIVFVACAPDGSQFATAPPPNEAALVVVPPRSAGREPQPIPGGLVIPPLIHIFLPGPVALGYQGEDVEPGVIRDFDGVTALAYLAGSATDRHGNTYHVESDIRVFQGTFVGADGKHHHGTYVLIWIDLFDPSSGSQLHDFNGGIAPSGLFWSVRVPDHAFTMSGGTARLVLPRVHVVDSRTFLGPDEFPGEVSIDLTWTATGPPMLHLPGSTNPADPRSWYGVMSVASAVGNFSGLTNRGFHFTAHNQSSAARWAELGTEKNGVFIP